MRSLPARDWLGYCGVLALGTLLATALAQPPQAIPPLGAHVTDLTGTLTAAQQAELEQKLVDFQDRKGAQIAVLMVPTTAPEAIEQYSIRVVEAWKLGRKNVDDGALLLIAKNDHTIRIENGYGLEGVLTDAASNRVIENTMLPLLRQAQYFPAISAGLDQMIALIDGESLPPPDQSWQRRTQASRGLIVPLLVAAWVAASVLQAVFGRLLGGTVLGAGVGLVVFALSGALLWAALAGGLAFGVMLLGWAGASWNSRGRGGPGGMPGGFGGFGGFGGLGGFGGGGSSGGFSGGGGSFGGGGASGRW